MGVLLDISIDFSSGALSSEACGFTEVDIHEVIDLHEHHYGPFLDVWSVVPGAVLPRPADGRYPNAGAEVTDEATRVAEKRGGLQGRRGQGADRSATGWRLNDRRGGAN